MSRECKTCGVENGRWPQAEYCSPRCWQKSLREPLDEEEPGADCLKFLRVFEARIERMREQTKPINDEEEPSIIWAIINWHKANPEMQLKSKDDQWKAWLQWENHCRTHRNFASWHRGSSRGNASPIAENGIRCPFKDVCSGVYSPLAN